MRSVGHDASDRPWEARAWRTLTGEQRYGAGESVLRALVAAQLAVRPDEVSIRSLPEAIEDIGSDALEALTNCVATLDQVRALRSLALAAELPWDELFPELGVVTS